MLLSYCVNTDSHVEMAEFRLCFHFVDNLNHRETCIDNTESFFRWVPLANVGESYRYVTIADRVQLEHIVIDANLIELIEEFSKHIYDLISIDLRTIFRETSDVSEENRHVIELIS